MTHGSGIEADAVPGVGFSSMRERAAELGGTFAVSRSRQGGTRVFAVRVPTLEEML